MLEGTLLQMDLQYNYYENNAVLSSKKVSLQPIGICEFASRRTAHWNLRIYQYLQQKSSMICTNARVEQYQTLTLLDLMVHNATRYCTIIDRNGPYAE